MYVTVCAAPAGYRRGAEVIDSFTFSSVAPEGTHSRTAERNPFALTFSNTVKPGCRRFDAASQPHTTKFGYTSAWLNAAGLGSGAANAPLWKARIAPAFGASGKVRTAS